MKLVILYLVFFIQSSEINEIKKLFSQWQPILHSKNYESKKLFNTSFNRNFEKPIWLSYKDLSDSSFVMQVDEIVYEKLLGNVVKSEFISPSGHAHGYSESYYNTNGSLYFVFYKFNTIRADVPTTVEKRYYFSKSGKQLKYLLKAYSTETKKKVHEGEYMDQEFEVIKNISSLPYKL